jgi:hypothetical protein
VELEHRAVSNMPLIQLSMAITKQGKRGFLWDRDLVVGRGMMDHQVM